MTLIRRDSKGIGLFALKMIATWIVAYFIFLFLRNFGIGDSARYEVVTQIDRNVEFLTIIFVGVVTGIFYTLVEVLFDRPYFQKIPFGKVILVKSLLYFLMVRFIFFLAVLVFEWLQGTAITQEVINDAMTSRTFWVILIYFLIVSAIISFVLQISQKFGPGMLWNFLIGKYHRPLEEDRIFLFIDLDSSTTHAEQLGHVKFSRLLQDCFFDLTDVVTRHRCDVYQYVGDEAVLSWPKAKGLAEKRCIRAYFDFMEILNSKSEHYLSNYGIQPFFKAGLHMGKVTVAEVGVVKKEIAYHGDVLNTTARIQAACNQFEKPLLASDEIIKNIELENAFEYSLVGSPILKGKKNKVDIYSVTIN